MLLIGARTPENRGRPVRQEEAELYHKVSAYGRMANQQLQIYDDRESAYSPLSYIMNSEKAAVEEIEANDTPAEYYSISGLKVGRKDLNKGLYILCRGPKTEIVFVK